MALLRATVDALRCPALGVVIAESWGSMRELDLTASRRLALAAEKSGVTLLLLCLNAEPVPSAAQTRWEVASAPSQALPGHAPGAPVFDITLLRQKSGPCGMNWRLEWDRDRRIFREAPLSGRVVPVPADRPAAAGAGWQELATGRSAA
jgi:protein ImuA